ncbi:hypothetical protein [Paraburkholderia sp. BCC1876]|uniref:hypothetical protein n=1 Tax=Paraburkholderia sp. BCC1876 TaxID=2676303 RepID=UPI001591A40A|nr:hypothetical protein [Paraburkholderia sp. BCC1876]
MKYYSVDRRGVYADGGKIELTPNLAANGNEIVMHINNMYPAGFSRHGMQFFRDPPPQPQSPQDYNGVVLELLLEATRKAHYPDKPSRYQSMFASVTLEEALGFKSVHGKPTDPVYEVAPQGTVHRGDMAIYTFAPSAAGIDHRLHLYWRGETLQIPGHIPKWEYVLELPVAVGNRVG